VLSQESNIARTPGLDVSVGVGGARDCCETLDGFIKMAEGAGDEGASSSASEEAGEEEQEEEAVSAEQEASAASSSSAAASAASASDMAFNHIEEEGTDTGVARMEEQGTRPGGVGNGNGGQPAREIFAKRRLKAVAAERRGGGHRAGDGEKEALPRLFVCSCNEVVCSCQAGDGEEEGSGTKDIGGVHVGARVRVYWEGDDTWYEGMVLQASASRGYRVHYDDGEQHWEEHGACQLLQPEEPDADMPTREKVLPQSAQSQRSASKFARAGSGSGTPLTVKRHRLTQVCHIRCDVYLNILSL